MTFDGKTYEPARDKVRLTTLLGRVRAFMSDNPGWHTLAAIREAAGGSEASVSARLRDLRKAKFGGWDIDRASRGRGLFEYRMRARTDYGQLTLAAWAE